MGVHVMIQNHFLFWPNFLVLVIAMQLPINAFAQPDSEHKEASKKSNDTVRHTQLRCLSADGRTIVGYGTNINGDREGFMATLSSVPEPSSGLLLLSMFVGLGVRRIRRR